MLVLGDNRIADLLDMASCIRAIDTAFRRSGEGSGAASKMVGLDLPDGALHAKLGVLAGERAYAVAKVNANLPDNPATHALPTIQGVVVLFDASRGIPLAVMDSGLITAMRTAATTAVASTYLAVRSASTLTFIGCGVQARSHLEALRHVHKIERVFAFDIDRAAADRFADECRARSGLIVEVATDVHRAARAGDIVITLTPSRRALLDLDDVRDGTFIAAIGADSEHKREISSRLLQAAVVVVDDLEQCSRIGDLHHALAEGVMQAQDVRGTLDQIVSGRRPGRQTDDEIIVFDSTGLAIEDVAVAALAYERVCSWKQ